MVSPAQTTDCPEVPLQSGDHHTTPHTHTHTHTPAHPQPMLPPPFQDSVALSVASMGNNCVSYPCNPEGAELCVRRCQIPTGVCVCVGNGGAQGSTVTCVDLTTGLRCGCLPGWVPCVFFKHGNRCHTVKLLISSLFFLCLPST